VLRCRGLTQRIAVMLLHFLSCHAMFDLFCVVWAVSLEAGTINFVFGLIIINLR
jgi:hypothetical protein